MGGAQHPPRTRISAANCRSRPAARPSSPSKSAGCIEMSGLGKILLGFGVLMVILGAILLVAGNLSGKVPWLGRLPGDIYIRRDNWTFYFPLATSLIVSLILT